MIIPEFPPGIFIGVLPVFGDFSGVLLEIFSELFLQFSRDFSRNFSLKLLRSSFWDFFQGFSENISRFFLKISSEVLVRNLVEVSYEISPVVCSRISLDFLRVPIEVSPGGTSRFLLTVHPGISTAVSSRISSRVSLRIPRTVLSRFLQEFLAGL